MHGPYAPDEGHRFNPAKLLIDPYAKAIEGDVDWEHDANVLPYVPDGDEDADLEPDDEDDSAGDAQVGRDRRRLRLGGRPPPRIPFADTIIYETHVKGFTMRHPDVREDLRGTYAGLASEPAHRVPQGPRRDRGRAAAGPPHLRRVVPARARPANYWGYSTIGYFAPHSEYAATGRRGEQVREFKGMVKALHQAGIEVILDVVYNHTAEGNHLGPMLSFKGVDNAAYYRLVPDDPRHYMDFTGTGNSLNPVHPSVLRLIMDSLRYFVTECHVDGFRFDLASALARELYDVDRLSAFFDIIHQDPVLSQVKLIAEPWDVGPGGYQVGNFPILWSEWNGVYRDAMRDFWRAQASVGEFASRLSGSADLYESDGRDPFASINFITAHDGFTLRDLVSYNDKHNEANREDNRDGTDDNRSWNCGVEGETDDPEMLALRARQQRNFLTTLFVSQGTPMLLGGDELGRTQGGNNNGWCQDSEISWYDWSRGPPSATHARLHPPADPLRREHCAFRRESFLRGQEINGSGAARRLVVPRRRAQDDPPRLAARRGGARACSSTGEAIPSRGPQGEEIDDDSFLLLFNAHGEDREFTLPRRRMGARWELELSHRRPGGRRRAAPATPRASRVDVTAHSITILKRVVLDRERSVGADTTLRATYRLQLTPDFGFAGARGADPLPARPRDLAPVPVAVAAGAARVDPRLRRDRPDAAVGRARRRGGVPGAGQRRHGAGLGIVLDIVPNHMATDDANRFWADPALRERFFDIDPVDRALPALLRHRRPGRRPPGGPRGVRGDPPAGARAGRARALVDGAADRSSRRAGRPGRVPRAAARRRASSACGSRRSSSPASALRDWPVSGTVGYEFLNDVCGAVRRPAARGGVTALWERSSGRRAAVRARSRWRPSSSRPRGTFTPEIERLARVWARRRCGRWSAGRGGGVAARSTARTSSRARARSTRRTGSRSTRRGRRRELAAALLLGALGARRSSSPASSRRRRRSWPRASRTPRSTATAGCCRCNDVGGDPGRFGISVERFHAGDAERARRSSRRRC